MKVIVFMVPIILFLLLYLAMLFKLANKGLTLVPLKVN
nr:MAG TPA: hypothetical protein [Bacteriophage sp.]